MMDEATIYMKNQRRYLLLLTGGIVCAAALFITSLCLGNYKTSPVDVISALLNPETNPQIYMIIMRSRLPRLLASVLVGASLSAAGLTYQEIFSNRMASPDILGVSAGAGVGASVSIYFGFGFLLTGLFSFIGGVCAVSLTAASSKFFERNGGTSVSLILAGIVVGGLMNSLLGLFKYLSNDSQLSSITFWLLGGFYNTNWSQVIFAAVVIAVGIPFLFLYRWNIVMLRSGDNDAYTHGINAKFLRKILIIITTIMTSAAICISGTIGWIGLAIPNLVKLLVQNDGKKLMLLSIVYGILFTEICDLLARSIIKTEIPVGIISGFIGAVMFILVLLVQAKRSK
jgi:iron complex transport system permease protein|nr:iron ABC transporter permease [uncultured Acetatifactor sp.]